MKKTLLFGFISLLIGFSVSAQQIPNGDLENWTENVLLGFEDPDDWQTPNQYTALLSIFTTTKVSDAAEGSFAAKLEAKDVGGFITPGVITLGDFTVDFVNNTAYLTGGIPFTDKPAALTGSWKNFPVSGDFTMIIVYFTKYSSDKGQTDTIGIGQMMGTETVDSWTAFNIPIEFFSTEDPDTMNLHVVSSNMLNLQLGSTIYVDDLAFEYEAGINEINNKVEASVFPNPASEHLTFSLEENVKAELNVFNNDGQLVYSASVNGNAHKVDVSQFSAGTYFYSFVENSERISSGQFMISK
jgi:hypothetical protein